MTLKRLLPLFLCGLMSATAMAQLAPEDPDWKELEAPPPPAFNLDKLIAYDGTAGSGLVYAIDPTTLVVGSDGIVRYVLVASSATGTRNIMYEAIRCATGEVKTYARYNANAWSVVERPEWRSIFGGNARYSLRFARAGGCDNAAAPVSADSVVRSLRSSPNAHR